MVTAFQQRVYDLTREIPQGKVVTYGEIAKVLNSSPRAVGNALRRNPFAPAVPCHRVIAKTRHLHGFNGQSGADAPNLIKKKKILVAEGVSFEENYFVSESSIHYFNNKYED